MENDRAIKFLEGTPVTYEAQNDTLKFSLTLRNPKKDTSSRSHVDYTYEAEVIAENNTGGLSKSKAGWTHYAYFLYANGSFGGIFNEVVENAGNLCYLLRSRIGGDKPNQSSLIRLMHQVEDEIKKDFLHPRGGWTNLREDLFERFFQK